MVCRRSIYSRFAFAVVTGKQLSKGKEKALTEKEHHSLMGKTAIKVNGKISLRLPWSVHRETTISFFFVCVCVMSREAPKSGVLFSSCRKVNKPSLRLCYFEAQIQFRIEILAVQLPCKVNLICLKPKLRPSSAYSNADEGLLNLCCTNFNMGRVIPNSRYQW